MLIPDPVRPDLLRAKILDFGIARLQHRSTPEPGNKNETSAGAVMGTPLYMAPEQFGQAETAEGAADVFALGVIFYELLTGRLPYQKSSLGMIGKPPAPIRKLHPRVSKQLELLTLRMMALAQAERPSMSAVAAELEALFGKAQKHGGVSSFRRPLSAVGLGVVTALLIGAPFLWSRVHRREPMTQLRARMLARSAIESSLRAPHKEDVLQAVQAISKSRDPSQSALLTPLLGDPSVGGAAARALGDIGAVSEQPALLERLETSRDERVQIDLATGLLLLSHPKGLATLHALLHSTNEVTRVEAALRLAEYGDIAGADLLHRIIDGKSAPSSSVLAVLMALARAGDDEARQELFRQMNAAGRDSRRSDPMLLFGLARIGDLGARGELLGSVGRAGPDQLLSARLLAGLGECGAGPLLLLVAQDQKQPDASREIAIEGLADCERTETALQLAELIPDPASRRLSLVAAGAVLRLLTGETAMLAERSLSWARMALGSNSTASRELAVALLGNTASASSVEPLGKALSDREPEVRRGAARALGRKHVRAALETLRVTLRDADSDVRTVGMRSMGQVVAALRLRGERDADRLVAQGLRKIAETGDEVDSLVASGILLQLGDSTQIGTLRAGLRSATPLVRRLAIEMIDGDAVALRSGLADPDRLVRLSAARRLVAMGLADGREALREMLRSGDAQSLIAYGLLRKLGDSLSAFPLQAGLHLEGATAAERTLAIETAPELPVAIAAQVLLLTGADASTVIRQRAAEMAFDLFARTQRSEFRSILSSMRNDSNIAVRLTVAELVARLPEVSSSSAVEAPPPSPRIVQAPDLGQVAPADAAASPDLVTPAVESPQSGATPEPSAQAANAWQAAVETLLQHARVELQRKKYASAQSDLDRAQRLIPRTQLRSTQYAQLLQLRGAVFEQRGTWREAMALYIQYQRLPPAQKLPASTALVEEAVTRLKQRMGRVQVYTNRGGACLLTDEYYLPAGEHIISSAGETRTVTIEAGGTTTVKQCP